MLTTNVTKEEIAEELRKCRRDGARFNWTILGRDGDDGHGNRGYWPRQREICRSIDDYPITLVPTGNAVGKSFVDAGEILRFLYTHPNSLVVATAPSQTQLEEVLWKEVERAYRGARVPLGGRLLRSPLKVDLGDGWQALAYSTTKTERFSGHHGKDVFAVPDEASGIADPIKEAIDSLNPSRFLATGNPLRPDGWFYEACQGAPSNRLANVIQISSLESPHIDLPRSPWGLADATWLEKARNDYGEGSIWWKSHVEGRFPEEAFDAVIPPAWLNLAARAKHVRRGPTRTAIDLAEGNDGDRSVVLTRDDNGVLDLEFSRKWSLEMTASRAALQAQKWGVQPHHVSFDVAGIGADFDNRLRSLGIVGANPYRGGASAGSKRYANLRTAAAWSFRQRLDPKRMVLSPAGVLVPQDPFAIRPEWVALMRAELQGLRYTQSTQDRIVLEDADEFRKRLKGSPDFQATICQSFSPKNR